MDRNVTNSDKCMIPLNYGLEIFPEYLAPKSKIRAPNVGLASPIATEILALEKPRNLALCQNGAENYFRFRFLLHF